MTFHLCSEQSIQAKAAERKDYLCSVQAMVPLVLSQQRIRLEQMRLNRSTLGHQTAGTKKKAQLFRSGVVSQMDFPSVFAVP